MQKDIDVQSAQLAKFEQKATKQHYIDLADEAYSRAIFDVQKGMGIGFSFAGMSKSRTQDILKQNWSGKHCSERIWGKASEINKTVKKELLVQFMTGRSYRKTASEIEQRMAVGAMEARRLVRTESTYVANSAELESYKECGVNKFEFVATLDMRTSDICAAMDGKTFDIDKGIPGTSIPPLHPWCRSTTIAVIDAAVTDGLKRRAKDPETGKYVEVPADITYKQWKESVDNGGKNGIIKAKKEQSIDDLVAQIGKIQNQQMQLAGGMSFEDIIKDFGSIDDYFGEDTDKVIFLKLQSEIDVLNSKITQKVSDGIFNRTLQCGNVKYCSDFNMLSDYLDAVHSIKMDNAIKTLDFQTVKECITGFETVATEYADLSKLIQEITIDNSGVMSCSGTKITFNPQRFIDRKKIIDTCDSQSSQGFWMKNSSPTSIGVHEAAHGVEWVLIQENKLYSYDYERILAWNDCTEAKKIVSQACKNIKKTAFGKGKKNDDLKKSISRYAGTTDSETMAEAFADVFANGKNANPLSIEIKKLTKEQLKLYKGGV